MLTWSDIFGYVLQSRASVERMTNLVIQPLYRSWCIPPTIWMSLDGRWVQNNVAWIRVNDLVTGIQITQTLSPIGRGAQTCLRLRFRSSQAQNELSAQTSFWGPVSELHYTSIDVYNATDDLNDTRRLTG